jgi:hypothetical protein
VQRRGSQRPEHVASVLLAHPPLPGCASLTTPAWLSCASIVVRVLEGCTARGADTATGFLPCTLHPVAVGPLRDPVVQRNSLRSCCCRLTTRAPDRGSGLADTPSDTCLASTIVLAALCLSIVSHGSSLLRLLLVDSSAGFAAAFAPLVGVPSIVFVQPQLRLLPAWCSSGAVAALTSCAASSPQRAAQPR